MILDTSGLLAYLSSREPAHQQAVTHFEAAGPKLTHNYILAELVALAGARKLARSPVLAFIELLIEHPLVEIVWVTQELNAAALSLLESRRDKAYSLADAVSFVLMRDRGIEEGLTTDHHFEQEGFRRLLPAL
jgi:uncharacterized protein